MGTQPAIMTIACSALHQNEEGPQLKDVERLVNNLGKLSDELPQPEGAGCVCSLHAYRIYNRKCKPGSAHNSSKHSKNSMEQIFSLVLTALSLVTATARADVSDHYLPPGSRPPSGQYLPPSNRPPPPVQFPADGSQPPGAFEDPESVVIEADPFGRGLNFPQGEQRTRGGFRGQQPSPLQRNFNSNRPALNYLPASSPTYVHNSLTPTSSPNRNYPAVRYVTAPLPSNQLVPQQTYSGYPLSNKQSGYSYEAPKVPFTLPRQNYRNSHVTLRSQPTTASDFLVSSLDLSSRAYADNRNSYYHGGTYQNNEQLSNQRVGYTY
ncbi:hypothetical protein LSTR_LSTR011315 [Laodelphax striatellus]|uniref:Uncharacterized protein n=1 Tax=Laodelphax striatellus TaxID=195883 RepID=A0A482WH33_LAOST|nr:hypothetical protein LSTR_LSTR011315 [Laodelphax striatellus]